jgi:hypothetical protein
MERRRFLTGSAAFIAAPAIIKVASLMPISVQEFRLHPVGNRILTAEEITQEAYAILSVAYNRRGLWLA